MLPPRYVIPVKSSEEAKLSPEIPAHQDVLALYPGTTCFYKATVIAPPSKVIYIQIWTLLLYSHACRVKKLKIIGYNSKMIMMKSNTLCLNMSLKCLK